MFEAIRCQLKPMFMTRTFLLVFGFFSINGLGASIVPVMASEMPKSVTIPVDKGFNHRHYDQILRDHVVPIRGGKSSLVDYQTLKSSIPVLEDYLSKATQVDPFYFDQWPPDEQLAFLINVYNAQTLLLVVQKYPELESIKDLGWFFEPVWKKDVISLFGKMRSLDDIEHELIRGDRNFKKYSHDPRVHFALNCASISCPGLYEYAFTGDKLQEQLDQVTWRFLSDRTRNVLSSGILRISPIFDWYSKDFQKSWQQVRSVREFLAKYHEALGLSEMQTDALLKGQILIEFMGYDWTLNDGRKH